MSDKNKTVKEIPYGISDYGIIRNENYYYVDKTQYLEKLQKAGLIKHHTEYLMEIMRQWYNHYIFSKEAQTTLFNSDMVLYFLAE